MQNIRNFNDLVSHLSQRGLRKRVAGVFARDHSSQQAVLKALEAGFIDAVFVGCREDVEAVEAFRPHAAHISFVDVADPDEAARVAVEMVREGKADILMKGLINTDNLLRAVLNKETGILPRGRVLTHITAAHIPDYAKMLFFTDAAVIPYPTQEQREEQVKYIADLCRALGVAQPRISLIHCSEKVSEKAFPHTVGYKAIVEQAAKGAYGPCIVDGPLDAKVSCCRESMLTKGINSPINGEADALIFPDIEAGNVFYKTITLFAHADTAGILQGPTVPVVVPSRSDSEASKFNSLALAAVL